MGILGDHPAQRKSRDASLLKPSGEAKGMVDEPWDWRSVEGSRAMNDGMSHESPDASSSKHLISPSMAGSSTESASFQSCSAASPPFVGGCSNAFGGKVPACHRKHQRGDGAALSGFGSEFPLSRWDSSRWSADASCRRGSDRPRGNRMCKCAAMVSGDLAAVCCCPFSLLHLLAIAFIKLPSALLAKTLAKLKRKIMKRRRRGAGAHEDEDDSVAGTSFPPSRCGSYEEGDAHWGPALEFVEKRLWRDYFDSPDAGIWSTEEPLKPHSVK